MLTTQYQDTLASDLMQGLRLQQGFAVIRFACHQAAGKIKLAARERRGERRARRATDHPETGGRLQVCRFYKTKRTLDRITAYKEQDVVVADGPRDGRPNRLGRRLWRGSRIDGIDIVRLNS
jgi:hypothetical protein